MVYCVNCGFGCEARHQLSPGIWLCDPCVCSRCFDEASEDNTYGLCGDCFQDRKNEAAEVIRSFYQRYFHAEPIAVPVAEEGV
jgi:hypothetical protein